MVNLPLELFRAVLRKATAVHGAFDYPAEMWDEHDKTVEDLIEQSFKTKLALSLVSKLVHQLSQEFLYEIIRIRNPEHIRPLVLLLKLHEEGCTSRGWWCRRLDVSLKHWSIGWRDGRFTLWGLLQACPRLVDLRILLRHCYPRSMRVNRFDFTPPRYCVTPTLLQTIATLYGPTLRHLTLGWRVAIPFTLAKTLLAHLPALEACRLDNVRVPRPAQPPVIWTFANPTGAYNMDPGFFIPGDEEWTEEEEEEPDPDPYGSGRDSWGSSEEDSENEGTDKSNEREEYRTALASSTWPHGHEIVFLPRLRVLRCSHIFPDIGRWQLPALRNVSFGHQGYESAEASYDMIIEALSKAAHNITHFAYLGPTKIDIWRIVHILPCVSHLHICTSSLLENSSLSAVHSALLSISISPDTYHEQRVSDILRALAEHIESGFLPTLQSIHVLGGKLENLALRTERFATIGVKLHYVMD
ncbi:hypothetical protein CALCODRAFT_489571 [Calocera cornea HHB12733]|uniref:F-box domain-containing protein n=1 Tax=Calocera cornea HHB12733 TaxID=1353952 RepID=A0A165K2N9_9BASI|nr:hypothetical protein CALCODRAFT_489571 [Calocera cornea HHB12733]